MVRKRVLLPLVVAAGLLVAVGFAHFVVPLSFEVPCRSCAAVDAVCIGFGVLNGIACCLCYTSFADGEEEEAAGAAKKAGCVTIAGDLEVAGTGAGGKN